MTSTGHVWVDTIHLNVGIGDCSVVCKLTTPTSPGGLPVLASVVLIDGGFATAASVIEKFFEVQIGQLYDLTGMGRKAKLTAVVITHWDGDHYGGISSLLRADLTEQGKGKTEEADIAKVRCSYFIYTDDRPITTMYVPYWKSGTIRRKGHVESMRGTDGATGSAVGDTLDYNYGSYEDPKWARSICRLKSSVAMNLGVNLFTGTGPGATKNLTSPSNLATELRLGDQEPALVCVACDRQGVWSRTGTVGTGGTGGTGGSTGLGKAVVFDHLDSTGGAIAVHKFGSIKIVNKPTGNTEAENTNKASMACVVLWSTGRVSHYLAGDSYWEEEGPLIAWIRQSGTPIGAVKLSHHGAEGSSPRTLFTELSPKTVVVSSGTMHGHPRWELLLWLDLWALTGRSGKAPFFCPMIYPYWLQSSATGMPEDAPFVIPKGLNISIANSYHATANTPLGIYQKDIDDMKAKFKKELNKKYDFEFTDSPAKGDAARLMLRMKLWARMCSIWDNICPLKSEWVSYGQGQDLGNVLSYWRVCCRITPNADGNSDGQAYGQPLNYNIHTLRVIPGFKETHQDTRVRVADKRTRAGKEVHGTELAGQAIFSQTLFAKSLNAQGITDLVALEAYINGSSPSEGSPGELEDDGSGSSGSGDMEVEEKSTVAIRDVNQPATLVLPTDHDFFICTSTLVTTTGTNALVVAGDQIGGALDLFLDGLTTGMLALEAAPDPVGKALLTDTADFPDDMFTWLEASLKADKVLAQGIPNSITPLTGFVVQISKPWGLQFTTSAFLANPPVVPLPVMPFGFQIFGSLLTLGLDTTSGSSTTTLRSTTLAVVMDFIGMDEELLQGLGSPIGLTLDTSAGSRNTMWFGNQPKYQSVVRLQFTLMDEATFQRFINNPSISPNLALSNIRLIVRNRATQRLDPTGFNVRQDPQLIVTVTVTPPNLTPMDAIFIFEYGLITFIIKPKDGSLEDTLGWLAFLTPGANQDDVKKVKDWVRTVSPSGALTIREMRLAVNGSKLQAFFLDLEVDVDFGKSPDGSGKVAFFFSYTYSITAPHHTITGSLWTPSFPGLLDEVDQHLMPEFETYKLVAKPSDTYSGFIYASNIFPNFHIDNVPQELDLEISQLDFSLSSDQFTFVGAMTANPKKTAKATHFALQRVVISATWIFEVKTNAVVTTVEKHDVSLATIVVLKSPNVDENANLSVSVAYVSPIWKLTGTIDNLKMSALASLFPNTDGSTVMEIMDHFEIIKLAMDYDYDTTGTGGSFDVSASLLLDIFELDFSFNWTKTPAAWDIFASLTLAPTVHTNLKNVLKAVLKDPTLAHNIPDFANIDISGHSSGVELVVKKGIDQRTQTEAIVFALSLLLKGTGSEPDIRFSFIQIKQLPSTQAAGTGTATPTIKRVVRVSVNSIPWGSVPNIPMVGSLKQPFNEIDYAWVHDDATGDISTQGLTRQDIGCINAVVSDRDASLTVKVKDLVAPAKAKPTDILLPPGSHFLVIADDVSLPGGSGVVLDYLCRSSKDEATGGGGGGGGQELVVTGSNVSHLSAKAGFATNNAVINDGSIANKAVVIKAASTPTPANEPEGEAAMGKHTETQGPLSISNIGLRYSNGTLSVLFDATVKLGPIEFSLLGFGIGIDLTGLNLRSLLHASPTLSLKGLAAEYNEPPLIIAGIFENLSSPNIVKYVGGISVGFEPYSFLAVGSYGEITQNNHTFKSVFIFAKLEGPLIEFEFAEISGICGGFGYNSYVRYPSLAELYSFPFVDNPAASALSGADPLAILESLTSTDASNPNKGWVSDQEGSIWLAAGLKVKAFQTLSINAVVVLEFNPYVSLGIFADAVASLPPPEEGKSPIYVLYVELGIVATVDFHGGTMRVEASLSPNSYVLNPLCHLSGGFALCYWFAGSPFEGDWVFTVGGYHAAFSRPDHYPNPDRLQIYWGLGGGLTITGQAYLAVTPKCCMLGGLLSAALDAGLLGAYFNAHADLLITYKPFHFKGTAGIEIGVHFTLDLFICTIHISVDISAELSLYGPPFGGDVWVDFWVFGFSIHFGDDEHTEPILDLPGFNTLLLQQHDATSSVVTKPIPPTSGAPAPIASTNYHVFAVEKGRHVVNKSGNNTEQSEGAPWVVKSQGFAFRVQSRFAIETSTCNGEAAVSTTTAIYAKPMHLVADTEATKDQHITSTMAIAMTQTQGEKPFTVKAIIKKVPQALWAPYNPAEDPNLHGNHIDTLTDGSSNLTVDLIMGLTLTAPPPILSKDLILPFDAKDSMAQDVFTDQDHAAGLNPLVEPKPVFTASDWNPVAHPTGVQDTDESLWTSAQSSWQRPQDLGPGLQGKTWGLKDVADLWKGAMMWKEAPVPAFPTSFVNHIETYYMSAPFMGS